MSKKAKIVLAVIIAIFIMSLTTAVGLGSYVIYKIVKNNNTKNSNTNITVEVSNKLEKFTDSDFDNYVEKYNENLKNISASQSSDGLIDFDLGFGDVSSMAEDAVPMVAEKSADETGGGAESITNIQEAGVDEGDIVKAYKDYLVVLSRGRLFTVQVKDGDTDLLDPTFKGEAYAKGSTLGTWYDEMLIYHDNVVVVGYSYAQSATEIGLFKIDEQGQITHQDTYFIDSNDYYSSRNYTSRLVDGKLIFYMPYYMLSNYYDDSDTGRGYDFPQIKKWISENKVSDGVDMLNKTDIYKPVQDTDSPTLHTVVTCDLNDNFNCSARAVLGPYARNFYVSPDAVYMWVAEYSYNNGENTEPNAYVYRMPLDANEEVGAIQAYGYPLDQFSFKQTSDNYLNVLVQEHGFGEAMWNPEYSDSGLALLRVSLDEFKTKFKTVEVNNYRSLPELDSYSMQNRFVGDYLLYGSGDTWFDDAGTEKLVYITNYTDNNPVQKLDLDSDVERIEVLNNENALVVGSSGDDLLFNWITLSDASEVTSIYTSSDAAQGETRSHGFFYSVDQGILGLPIREYLEEGYYQLIDESSKVVYLSVNQQYKTLDSLGSLDASEQSGFVQDDCLYSCVDWYGNSRPIFYAGRIFALMGYEIVEGKVNNNVLQEISRVNYYKKLIR